VASQESRLLPTPETEVDAAAERGVATAAAGAAAETASTAAAGAAAAGASLLVATGVTASEGVEATTARGVSTASLAEPLLPADGTDTTGVSLLARRGAAAAEEAAPLRVADESPEELVVAAAWPRRGAVAFVVDPVEAWSLEAPAEPVVSAYAIGIAEIAEPMPSAIARAPTRPMYLE